MNHSLNINNISRSVESVINKIFETIDFSNINNSRYDRVIMNEILENREDEVLFNETVEFLQKNKNIKEKEISLSNDKSLIISIE